jgi:hypothetical protein
MITGTARNARVTADMAGGTQTRVSDVTDGHGIAWISTEYFSM